LKVTGESIQLDVIRADDGTVEDSWVMTAGRQE